MKWPKEWHPPLHHPAVKLLLCHYQSTSERKTSLSSSGGPFPVSWRRVLLLVARPNRERLRFVITIHVVFCTVSPLCTSVHCHCSVSLQECIRVPVRPAVHIHTRSFAIKKRLQDARNDDDALWWSVLFAWTLVKPWRNLLHHLLSAAREASTLRRCCTGRWSVLIVTVTGFNLVERVHCRVWFRCGIILQKKSRTNRRPIKSFNGKFKLMVNLIRFSGRFADSLWFPMLTISAQVRLPKEVISYANDTAVTFILHSDFIYIQMLEAFCEPIWPNYTQFNKFIETLFDSCFEVKNSDFD